MTTEDPERARSLDDIYAFIDKSRTDAAKTAQVKFYNDVEGAISTIVNIGSVAGARVMADSRVASAKILINAELAATHLLADAEMQASKCASEVLTKPREVVEAAILEVGRLATWRLTASARESVEAIQHDAEFAIGVLKEAGANAILEIQALAATVATQTKLDAEQAAEKLKEYRKHAHTAGEAASEGESAARLVIEAAEGALAGLQEVTKVTLAKINSVTEEACSAVRDAANAAEQKILGSRDRALARLRETLRSRLA